LNTSLQIWYEQVIVDSAKTKEALSETNSWVDVRDTALGHVLALEKDAAGGQRIITASGACHL
jgi:nucleoside-diphosphate-sugar epimerase